MITLNELMCSTEFFDVPNLKVNSSISCEDENFTYVYLQTSKPRQVKAMGESLEFLLGVDGHPIDTETFIRPMNAKQARRNHIAIYTGIALTLLVSALITGGVVELVTPNSHDAKNPELLHCGKSDTEARSLHCEFDVMDLGWVHPRCWDQDLLDEYAPPNRWIFGWDKDHQEPITQAQASTGNVNTLWVRNDYHAVHCVYAFHKMAKAVAQGRPVNKRAHQLAHAHHCSMSLHRITAANLNETGLGAANYMSCGYI